MIEIDYNEKIVTAAGKHIDDVDVRIITRDFEIKNQRNKTKVCKGRNFKYYCRTNE
jgi:hypothetical protein